MFYVYPLQITAEVGAIWRNGKHATRSLVVAVFRVPEVGA